MDSVESPPNLNGQTKLRRSHHKSRHGCAECKRRKVKCDEIHPKCSRCQLRSTQCQYWPASAVPDVTTCRPLESVSRSRSSSDIQSSSDIRSRSKVRSSSNINIRSNVHISSNGTNLEDSLSRGLHLYTPDPTPPTMGNSIQELELIHHYACHTYRSLTDDSAHDFLWREMVPTIAFSHPFLLHGVLAVSALHLAHISPIGSKKQMYRRTARKYYTSAIALFRGPLNQIEPENSHAVFAFSTLAAVVGIGLRQPDSEEDQGDGVQMDAIDVLLEGMALIIGVRAIVEKYMHWIEKGPLAHIVRSFKVDNSMVLAPGIDTALKRLDAYNLGTVDDDGPCSQAEYTAIIAQLRTTFQLATIKPNCISVTLAWQAPLSQEYLNALRQKKTLAVVIVAHYGVLLDRLNHSWWASGLGRRVVASAVDITKAEGGDLLQWVIRTMA